MTVPERELAEGRVLGGRLAAVAARVRRPPPGLGSAPEQTRVAVVCHPAVRSTRVLAAAIARGARAEGAEVRLRRVTELVPLDSHADMSRRRVPRCVADGIPIATLQDLEWADAIAFGAPARVGVVAPELTYFLETAEPLRAAGKLARKAATAFTVTSHVHTGSESALLSLYNAMHHWGAVIVAPGYTDPVIAAAGGNPYGSSHVITSGCEPTPMTLAAACHQGRRLTVIGRRLRNPAEHSEGSDACIAAR
jgi:multimeric flavodoxin WrbA